MSAAHAQGSVRLTQKIDRNGNPEARIIGPEGSIFAELDGYGASSKSEEQNARRLVACWNACDGLDTQGLEDMAKIGESIKAMQGRAITRQLELGHQRDHFQALAKDNGQVIIKTACELGEVKAQRDQLSAALGTSTANYATLAAKLAQAESQRDALLVQLQEAVRLYESYGLVAGVFGCGKWVNDSRDAITATTRSPT